MSSKEITIKFDSEEVAKEFAIWLTESGETDFWAWMRGTGHPGVDFCYHGEDGRSGFLEENVILVASYEVSDE